MSMPAWPFGMNGVVTWPCAGQTKPNWARSVAAPAGAASAQIATPAAISRPPSHASTLAGQACRFNRQRRSSGAYSSIKRRSAPSSKRTVTTPSGSIRVTMPVPSV